MDKSITTSIRLNPALRQQLDQLSQALHKGKTWIIEQALQEFVSKNQSYLSLAQEAQRQSIAASQLPYDEIWERNFDAQGWTCH